MKKAKVSAKVATMKHYIVVDEQGIRVSISSKEPPVLSSVNMIMLWPI